MRKAHAEPTDEDLLAASTSESPALAMRRDLSRLREAVAGDAEQHGNDGDADDDVQHRVVLLLLLRLAAVVIPSKIFKISM